MTTGVSWSRPKVEGQDQLGNLVIRGVHSKWQCDRGAFALIAGWHRSNPIPGRRVIRGGTSVGSAVDLVEANRLRPMWRLSDLQRAKGRASHRLLSLRMGVWDRCNPRGLGKTCAV